MPEDPNPLKEKTGYRIRLCAILQRIEDHIACGFVSQTWIKAAVYKGSGKEDGCNEMRSDQMISKWWGVEPSNRAPRGFWCTGPDDRKTLHTSLSSSLSVKAIIWAQLGLGGFRKEATMRANRPNRKGYSSIWLLARLISVVRQSGASIWVSQT